MQLTPEQVQEILEAAKPDIVAGLKKEIVSQAVYDITKIASQLIKDEVTKFASTEILPEIRQSLTESKKGLVSLVVPVAEAVTTELAAALVSDLKRKLESSYSRSKLLEALFK